VKVLGLSLAISLVIVLVNIILTLVVSKFSLYEKHDTITSHNLSVAIKLTVGRSLNTCLIPLLVNLDPKKWFDYGGLV